MSPEVARAEGIEAEVGLDLYAAAPTGLALAGLAVRDFGSLAGFAVRSVPWVMFNRVQPTGAAEPREDEIESAVAWLREKAGPAWALQLPEGPPDRAGLLARQGLAASGSWTKFARAAGEPPEAPTSLEVRIVGPDRADDFGAVTRAAFDLPPSFAEWLAATVGRPGWTHYVAYRDSTPAATAVLFVSGGTGWLGFGCCLPEHRRQGAQSALLSRRIADAGRAGATLVITETGTPPPGELDRHPSFRNILRLGFQPIYRRINWKPEPAQG